MANITIPQATKEFRANYVHTENEKVKLEIMNVQRQQIGSVDCGVFAIAFAASLANGEDPIQLRYTSDMCKYLKECFDSKTISPFTSNVFLGHRKISQTDTVDVFCNCRRPQELPMIG